MGLQTYWGIKVTHEETVGSAFTYIYLLEYKGSGPNKNVQFEDFFHTISNKHNGKFIANILEIRLSRL